MMRPSSLYRSDSRRQPNLEAQANNITEDSIDCGITALRCCNTPKCQKMANKRSFMIVFVLCGIFQGAIEMYFKISAKQAALTHDYDPMIIDWLLVSSGIFQGIFAIFVAFLGNKFHRTAWLGGLLMLQAFVCVLLIIPTLVHHSTENNTLDAIELSMLCIRHQSENLMSDQAHSSTTLALLFILQLFIGLSLIAFYTLGLSYLDDNVYEHESPALISAAIAARFWGYQLGSLVGVIVGWSMFDWFFGWIILAPILFIMGFLVVMFPKKLLSTVVRQAADNILETSNSHASLSNRKFIADVNFFPSIGRIFTNKIVLLNVLAAAFVQTGVVNFLRFESEYLQSRFFLPASEIDGLTNEWTSLLVSNLLKPPMLALAILVSGLIIAKANPSAKKIVMWNIFAACLVVIFFVLNFFIDCEKSQIAGGYRGKIIKPMCASDCLCAENSPFMPVCPENSIQTFYSPCYAGCGAEISINEIRMFGNCSCGIDTEIPVVDAMATMGGCGMSECRPYYIAFHGLIIMAAALIASTLVGKLIIGIRAVLPQDKSLAIAMELMFVGILVFIPGKIGYAYIASRTCQYESIDAATCFLHESPLFGDWLNVVTAGLVAIGIIFEVLLLFCVGDLILYGEDDAPESYRPIEMNTYSRNGDSYNPPEMSQNLEPEIMENPPTAALLQNYLQSIPPPSQRFSPTASPEPTYAQIQRQINQSIEGLDFRLQTPRSDENSSIASDYRSVTSNGCVYFAPFNPQPPRPPLNRAQSPETDF